MSNRIECRPAREGDLDVVASVWHESARHADGAPADMPAVEALRRRVDAELAAGWTLSIALVDGRVVGMLAVRKSDAVLDQLYVLPAAQGRGVGRRLLDQAMREMPGGFTLRTAAANVSAREFYEHMGMRLLSTGQHPRHGHPVCFYGWNVS